MTLQEYRRKRNFKKTPEPAGERASRPPGRLYVIQRHAASRLHYDFRLELDGVLKSWAVPKGPSLDPSVKALAVEVEDHPLDYADFEGVIPAGQYGGGTVMVWDQGTWEPEGNAEKDLKRGSLKFRLHGKKLQGSWALVRMHGRGADERSGRHNWLLIKHRDEVAGKGSRLDKDDKKAKSVVSGRTMDQIAADADRVWTSNRAEGKSQHNGHARHTRTKAKAARPAKAKDKALRASSKKNAWHVPDLPGANPAALPEALSPQLATLVDKVPSGDNWLHELKFDGYRLIAFVDGGDVRLLTRRGNDWTHRFPSVARAVAQLGVQHAVLDGEVVALTETGGTDFQGLQNSLQRKDDRSLVYYVFDLPYFNGYELYQTPLLERKQLLARVLLANNPDNEGVVRYSEHVQGQGGQVIDFACHSAMEGVISKRADSPYTPGRTKTWFKIKCLKRQEFVIGGYTKPQGSRSGFGSLLLGYYDDGRFLYCGNVGTGFTHDSLLQLTKTLQPLKIDQSPFDNRPPRSKTVKTTWVKPQLVGEVEFTEWTEDGMLRHPSFQGLREDKSPREIGREMPLRSRNGKPEASRAPMGRKKKSAIAKEDDSHDSTVAGVTLTNPQRVIYPEQDLTKLDLARFYETIADWVLPHVALRPLSLVRCPQGRGHQCFYQKHLTDSMPDALRGVQIEEKGSSDTYVMIDDLAGLVSLVQMGVLEIHPWGARADDVERPDRLVFDLDPGEGVAWSTVIEGAELVRDRLEDLGLQSFVRTTGGKGLHVVAPINRRTDWDEVKSFAHAFADSIVSDQPDRYMATMSKAKRRGKVFVDYLRNQRGATAVASYSTRARQGAPVATPLTWDELSPNVTADQFTVTTLPIRLAKLKKDPWHTFFKIRQSLTSKMIAAVNS